MRFFKLFKLNSLITHLVKFLRKLSKIKADKNFLKRGEVNVIIFTHSINISKPLALLDVKITGLSLIGFEINPGFVIFFNRHSSKITLFRRCFFEIQKYFFEKSWKFVKIEKIQGHSRSRIFKLNPFRFIHNQFVHLLDFSQHQPTASSWNWFHQINNEQL